MVGERNLTAVRRKFSFPSLSHTGGGTVAPAPGAAQASWSGTLPKPARSALVRQPLRRVTPYPVRSATCPPKPVAVAGRVFRRAASRVPRAAPAGSMTSAVRGPPTFPGRTEAAPAPSGPPAEAGPIRGRAAVERAVLRRLDHGVWRLPEFASNGDRRLFRQQLKVRERAAHSAAPAA